MFGAPPNLLPDRVAHNDSQYNGRRIKFRVPYTMPGELVVPTGTVNSPFPEGTFLHSVDKPFEVWGVKLTASQSVAAVPFVPVAAPAPNINKFWRVNMRDVSKNQIINKAAHLVDTLVDNDDNVWWFTPQPYTIIRAEGFEVSVDNVLAANALRAEVAFRGYLLILEPPSESR